MKRILAALIAATLLLAGFALAAVKPGDDFYYLDTAGVLSQEAEGVIYFCNQKLYEACGGQIVVAAVDSIGSADTYEYAYELFNEWGIGSAAENNGFLLLMAIREDDYYALSGSGVEGIFSSSALKKLNDTYLEPDFAAKNYEAGALKYFEQVLKRYADKYNLDLSLQDGYAAYEAFMATSANTANYGGARSGGAGYGGQHTPPPHKKDDGGSVFIYILIFVIIVALVAASARRGGRRRSSGGPVVFVNTHRPRHHYHAGPRPGAPRPGPRPGSRRPGGFSGRSGGGFGGFSGRSGGGFGGFSGRSGGGFGGFSGRSGGGFGGGGGGGGGSFGGGAGRGRH